MEWYTADTETSLIQPGLLAPPLVCLSWATARERIPQCLPEELQAKTPQDLASHYTRESGVVHHSEAKDWCVRLFENNSIWANAPFDLAVIAARYPDLIPLIFAALEEGRVYDVFTRQKLIDIARGNHYGFYPGRAADEEGNTKRHKISYSVAGLVHRLCGELELPKDGWRTRYAELYEVPLKDWPEEALQYSRLDAEILWPIFEAQEEYGVDLDIVPHPRTLFDTQDFQNRANMALHLASCWGVRTNGPSVRELAEKVRREKEEVKTRLVEAGLVRKTGVRNTKKTKELLLLAVSPNHVNLTDTGEKKVKAGIISHTEAIEKGYFKLDEGSCVASAVPALIDYARYGHLFKLDSTYLTVLERGIEKPLQTRFEVLRETGRTSSSNPNLQNPPRDDGVRECCEPRPGNLYVSADFDMAELCSLAQVCFEKLGKSRLGEVLNAGQDPHLDMAAQILGISYSEAKRRKKQGDPEIKEARTLGKAADFGFPGGLGVRAFIDFAQNAYGLRLSTDQVQDLKDTWFANFPEMPDYFSWVNSLMQGKARTTLDQLGFIRGGAKYTVSCNHFFQNRTAMAAKKALWDVAREQYVDRGTALFGTRTVLFLHDEIILEAAEEQAHGAAMRLEEVMVDAFTHYHPDLAPAVGATPVLMRRWYKGAEPVWSGGEHGKGVLIPWEPEEKAA